MIPAVLSNGRCKLFSSGDPNSVRKSEHDESSVNSCGTAKEQRRNKSDSPELVVTSNLLHEESKCVRGPSQCTSDACQEHGKIFLPICFTRFVLHVGFNWFYSRNFEAGSAFKTYHWFYFILS